MTMSTEETRVVRESTSAGVPVVCGRAGMHFTEYSADSIVPSKLAEVIEQCHEDLCKNHKSMRDDLIKYANDNFDVNKSTEIVINEFKKVIDRHGSVNNPKYKGRKRVCTIKETSNKLNGRFELNQPTAFVPFYDEFFEAMAKKNKQSKDLKKAFEYVAKVAVSDGGGSAMGEKATKRFEGFYVAHTAGMISEGRMRPYFLGPSKNDDDMIKVVDKLRPDQVLDNANTLKYMSIYEPQWFIDFLRRHVHNKSVVFIGNDITCSSATIKNAFDVNVFISNSGEDPYNFINKNWKDLEVKLTKHDIVICSGMGPYGALIAHKLWNKGSRINFIDIEYIADAICRSDTCPWISALNDSFSEIYESAFVPSSTDIITLTHNCNDSTIRYFESLSSNTSNYRLIWVDNGSDDTDTISDVASGLENCEAIYIDTNVGYARAVNMAIKKSISEGSADWIALVDNDIELTRGWLSNLINSAVANELDIISPLMSSGTISIDNIRDTLTSIPEFSEENPQQRSDILNAQYGTSIVESPTVSISCCVVKRQLFEQIGLFDEEFFIYGEDTDFFNRIIRMGKKSGIALGVYVHHDVGTTTSFMGEGWADKQKGISKKYINKKWSKIPKLDNKRA
jgi:GT2 family glycosyltransferase